MAGSVVPADNTNSAPGQQPSGYFIQGTSTTADGKIVAGIVILDPTTGLPVPPGGGGGGGGAVTIADGADVTLGAKADAAITNPATSGTLMSIVRGVLTGINSVVTALAGTLTIKPSHIELAALSSTGTGTPLVASQDCLGYRSISLQLLGTFSGTVTFQQSNDNTNWVSLPLIVVNGVGASAPVASATAVGAWFGPIAMRYVRFTVTAYTSGTIQGVVEIDVTPFPVQAVLALSAQSGNYTAAVGIQKSINSAFGGINVIPSRDVSLGSVVTHLSKSGVGCIFAITCSNANAAVRYFHVFNQIAALAGGETPVFSFPMLAANASQLVIGENFFGTSGTQFGTGILWGVSTTAGTYTAATAADHMVGVQYI